MISHISVVIAVRTARALARAVSMHALIECGLPSVPTMKLDDVFTRRLVIALVEGIGAGGRGDGSLPVVGLAAVGGRHCREPLCDIEDARKIFRPLGIAGQPEQIVGHARQHRRQSSTTQVSLVPPPCDELTTSEPAFSATRVSPPGTQRTLSAPHST